MRSHGQARRPPGRLASLSDLGLSPWATPCKALRDTGALRTKLNRHASAMPAGPP